MTLYGKWCDSVKVLESSHLSWIVLVDPKCNHMYLYRGEAEEVSTQTHTWEKAVQRQGQRLEWCSPTSRTPAATRSWKDARNILDVLEGNAVLPTLALWNWFWTSGLQNCERIHLFLFKATKFVVICCCRHRKLIQPFISKFICSTNIHGIPTVGEVTGIQGPRE